MVRSKTLFYMRFEPLIILSILLLLPFQSSAQKGLEVGFKGAFIGDAAFGRKMPNAVVTEEDRFSIYHNNGGQVGLDLAYYFDERTGLATGVNIGTRWIKSRVENPNSDRVASYQSGDRMELLEFPLSFVYRKSLSENGWGLSARFGPTVTFWRGVKYGGGVSLGDVTPGDTADPYTGSRTDISAKRPVLGLLLGLGLEKDLGTSGRIGYGISYHGQLTNGLRWDAEHQVGKDKGRSSGRFSSSFLTIDLAYYLPSDLPRED